MDPKINSPNFLPIEIPNKNWQNNTPNRGTQGSFLTPLIYINVIIAFSTLICQGTVDESGDILVWTTREGNAAGI